MVRRIWGAEYRSRRLFALAAAAIVAALGFIAIWGPGQLGEGSGGGASEGAGSTLGEPGGNQAGDSGREAQDGVPNESTQSRAGTKEPGAQQAADPIRLEISVSGDILIHSPIYRQALANGDGKYDFRPMFSKIRPVIRGADLSICHLETTLTKGAPSSYPIFATPAPLADAIAATGWDACSTASNHSLDKGLAGIRTTEKALNRAGVAHTGSASSSSRSRRAVLLRAGGAKIGLLSYTTMTNGIPLPEPWSVNLASPKRILADARRARQRGADAVIVNIHWGTEDSSTIDGQQLALAKAVTKSDVVTALVGQGPHVVQRIAGVNGSRVVFSEGNLLSNQTPSCCARGSQDGLIALLSIVIRKTGDHLRRVEYIPTWVRHPDFAVLPVGSAARDGGAPRAVLRASYQRTVSVAGRGNGVKPIPRRAP